MSLNKAILIGRLTKDPELRYTPSGVAVAQFTLAVNRPFSNSRGEREADFIPVVVWRKTAEACANHLRKGSQVAVDGRIQVRHYDNNEGRRVYVTEVVAESVQFLSPANGTSASNSNENRNAGETYYSDGSNDGFIPDDELPF